MGLPTPGTGASAAQRPAAADGAARRAYQPETGRVEGLALCIRQRGPQVSQSSAFMGTRGAGPLPRLCDGFVLRRLASDDLPEFQAYRHDSELGRYQGWSPMSGDEATVFLIEMNTMPLFNPGNWTQIAIAERDSGRLIGDIGVFLDQDGRHAQVGFTLARHAQGRGIATAALREVINLIFAATKVDRVVGITDARNSASVRLLERVGMRKTETTNAVFRGEQCVEYVYTVLRNDG